MVELDQIPNEIIEEIKSYYKDVSFKNYGAPINDRVVTRKLKFRITEDMDGPATVLDADTFEPKVLENPVKVQAFIARGTFTDELYGQADVYRILKMEAILAKEGSI